MVRNEDRDWTKHGTKSEELSKGRWSIGWHIGWHISMYAMLPVMLENLEGRLSSRAHPLENTELHGSFLLHVLKLGACKMTSLSLLNPGLILQSKSSRFWLGTSSNPELIVHRWIEACSLYVVQSRSVRPTRSFEYE
jgi:hypothetical protein